MDYFEVVDGRNEAIICTGTWVFCMEFIKAWGHSFVKRGNNQLWVS